jgi:hypothetical protein
MIEVALSGIIKALRKAFELKKPQIIERFLDENFMYFDPSGKVFNRKMTLKNLKEFFKSGPSFTILPVQIYACGSDILGWARYKERIRFYAQANEEIKMYWITIIFAKRDKKWLVVHIHISEAVSIL